MALTVSLAIEAGNLAVTILLLIEVASIKSAMRQADAIKVPTPPTIQLIKNWVA